MTATAANPAQNAKPRIVIDAGHRTDKGHGVIDPGAVTHDAHGEITEANQNYLTALTLKEVLRLSGQTNIDLTRPDPFKAVTMRQRTSDMGKCDLYISVHYNSPFVPRESARLAYYEVDARLIDTRASLKLATLAQRKFNAYGHRFDVRAESASRFGDLYISDALANCALLWEVGELHRTTREYRLHECGIMARAILDYLGVAPIAQGVSAM